MPKSRFSLLWAIVPLTTVALPAFAAPTGDVNRPTPDFRQVRDPARELRQLQDQWHQERAMESAQEWQSRSAEQPALPEAAPSESPATGFMFEVKEIAHTGSDVLTDDEFRAAVKPWVGRRIAADEIAGILDAINKMYREKGYVVCQAVVKPQRISGGLLTITLIEGKTDKATVEGNDTTRNWFVLNAFDLEQGTVANYREMIDALVRFNMTNDVALRIDIGPGEAPMSTAYRIIAQEPSRWSGAVFADTTGSKSTGRPRIGASVMNRSLFGIRDQATLLGVMSEGSKNILLGYSVPLTPFGTRLSGNLSYGTVEVVKGPSAGFDVSGETMMASLRLEHPVRVTATEKWTVWGEVSRQTSETDMFNNVRIADTALDACTLGLDGLVFAGPVLGMGNVTLTRHSVDEKLFKHQTDYWLMTGSLTGRYTFANESMLTVTGRWQSTLGGDELNSSDYFYFGHTAGIRGYDNDILSAESGFAGSVEYSMPIAGPETALFLFADAGRFTGKTISLERSLYSVGMGVVWPLFKGANLTATASFPLKRHLDDDLHVSRARADLSATMAW